MHEQNDPEDFIAKHLLRLNENDYDIDAAIQLGNYFYDQQKPAQAILYYRAALDINPALPGVRTDMATMYWQNGNVSFAEKNYRQVIREYPGFGNAYLNLGYLLLHAKQQLKQARTVWIELVEGWPEHETAHKIRELLLETMN